MTDALGLRFDLAVKLAAEAGDMAMAMRPPPGASAGVLKGPQDWLTEADGAVERFLSDRLQASFPEDGFQGEEGGISRGGSLRWVVDPIDGTSNYARGSARFCVSLACMEGGTPLIGVLVAPALRETVSARLGRGAHLNGAPVHVSGNTDPARSIMEVGWSRRRTRAEYLKLCEAVLARGSSLRHGGSGALGLVDTAIGRIDGYCELHINLWDVAAALAVLKEAGAAISDFLAGTGATNGNPIIACTPGLADAWSALPGLPSPA